MRIVYVEDNQANAFLVKRVASVGQHEFINYIDAESALRNFDRDDPDLLLVDLALAGEMNGFDLARTVRDVGYNGPLIAITVNADNWDYQTFQEAGFDECIIKPASVEHLVEILESL